MTLAEALATARSQLALVTFVTLGRTVVLQLAGGLDDPPATFHLPIGRDWAKRPGRREYLFATVTRHGREGGSVAMPATKQGAAMLSSATEAGGFIILDEATEHVDAGQLVEFMPIEPAIA